MAKVQFDLSCVVRPSRRSERFCADLVADVREVADRCFDGERPDYQLLTGKKEELDRTVVALARTAEGRLAGFCSCLLLPVEGVGDVFHLGLTCVDPDFRGHGLTHRLMRTAVLQYLVFHRPLGRVWFSNVACVLSSLGNVALNFDAVHPSPFSVAPPSATHLQIARAISSHYRVPIAISEDARLDEDAFVFRGSVPGTCFEKSESDHRYHHRDPALTSWYAGLLGFSHGDEVIQVGTFSLPSLLRYALARLLRIRRPRLPIPAPSSGLSLGS